MQNGKGTPRKCLVIKKETNIEKCKSLESCKDLPSDEQSFHFYQHMNIEIILII